MSDRDEDFRSMAIATRDGLKADLPDWEAAYSKMKPDYTGLDKALTGLDNLTGRKGTGTSRMRAEQEALDAAVPVIKGLRAVQLDAPSDALVGLVKLSRGTLDDLRDTAQVDRMQDLLNAANGIKIQLAEERVTDTHLTTLGFKIEALRALVASPRKQIIADSEVTAKEAEWMKKMRAAIKRLDVRVPNLQDELPEVVRRYQKARKLIKLGGRSKKDKPADGGGGAGE